MGKCEAGVYERVKENTFYSKRTHSIVREHILGDDSTLASVKQVCIRGCVCVKENTFYSKRTHSIVKEHIL